MTAVLQPLKPPPFVLVVNLDEGQEQAMFQDAFRLAGVSQAVFARLMGCSEASVSQWLSGEHRVSKMASRAAIAAALAAGVSIQVPNPSRYL